MPTSRPKDLCGPTYEYSAWCTGSSRIPFSFGGGMPRAVLALIRSNLLLTLYLRACDGDLPSLRWRNTKQTVTGANNWRKSCWNTGWSRSDAINVETLIGGFNSAQFDCINKDTIPLWAIQEPARVTSPYNLLAADRQLFSDIRSARLSFSQV